MYYAFHVTQLRLLQWYNSEGMADGQEKLYNNGQCLLS